MVGGAVHRGAGAVVGVGAAVQRGLRRGGQREVADGAVPLLRDPLHVLLQEVPLLRHQLQLRLQQRDAALLVVELLAPHRGQGAGRVDAAAAQRLILGFTCTLVTRA